MIPRERTMGLKWRRGRGGEKEIFPFSSPPPPLVHFLLAFKMAA